jgi:hypothetical protein
MLFWLFAKTSGCCRLSAVGLAACPGGRSGGRIGDRLLRFLSQLGAGRTALTEAIAMAWTGLHRTIRHRATNPEPLTRA